MAVRCVWISRDDVVCGFNGGGDLGLVMFYTIR